MCIVMIIILLPVVSGCSKNYHENLSDTYAYDNTTNISDLEAIEIDENEPLIQSPWLLQETKSFITTSHNLNKKNLIGILRYNNGKFYSVTPQKNSGYLFVLYEESVVNENNCLVVVDSFICNQKLVNKNDFIKKLSINNTSQEILGFDPNTYSDGTYSYHRFEDGSVVCIEYINDHVSKINDIDTQESNSVIKFLLPQDLELITSK